MFDILSPQMLTWGAPAIAEMSKYHGFNMEFSSFDFGEHNHDSCSSTCNGEVCLGGKVDRVIWAVDVLVDLGFVCLFAFS